MRNAAALPIALSIALFLTIGTPTSLPATAQAPKTRVVAGRGTAAPTFVTGIRDEARSAPPLSVARAHLSANRARYHVDVGELRTLDVLVDGSTGTVRFGQTYERLDVFGAEYLVHMNHTERGWATRSLNGHLFTELDVDVTPQILS